ncbi:hypothetical protein PIB30_060106 [Stylosanthes scabra]|uniref:Uncharacterized protein n=1 Tax=Stylosanthes scabra TaxID=79078 RepID=A0ABU6SLH2_9FABA|nr:hypothetical protein [Stylosanthes scabra]
MKLTRLVACRSKVESIPHNLGFFGNPFSESKGRTETLFYHGNIIFEWASKKSKPGPELAWNEGDGPNVALANPTFQVAGGEEQTFSNLMR